MTANKFLVPCKCHVALDDTRAHACSGLVGFPGMFRKLKASPAVADGKIRFAEWTIRTMLEPALESTRRHVIYQEERTRSELDYSITSRLTFASRLVVSINFSPTIIASANGRDAGQ